MKFSKYHALGNDYLVIHPAEVPDGLAVGEIQRICHRNYGVGSDGILLGPTHSAACQFGLTILNPDGSEAEKSGNGLRIFARYLKDEGFVDSEPFSVETLGGNVICRINSSGESVTVEMGVVSFHSDLIPVTGPSREVLNEQLAIAGQVFTYCAATVGNPHCIVLSDNPTEKEARQYGPAIEVDARFPSRTNVQFMKVIDRSRIRIEIWERGAGYTLASGSSSTAAAAVAHKLGLCDSHITVEMPGGELALDFNPEFSATMTGPVTRVASGDMSSEMFAWSLK